MIQRELKTRDFLKTFLLLRYPNFFKMMPFCCLQNNKNDIQACSEQTVKHTVLQCSLKESLLCREYDPFSFKSVQAGILKLWPLLYLHAKGHENAVNAMVMCNYKWPTNNVCVSSIYEAHIQFTKFIIPQQIDPYRFQANHAYSSRNVAPSRGHARTRLEEAWAK